MYSSPLFTLRPARALVLTSSLSLAIVEAVSCSSAKATHGDEAGGGGAGGGTTVSTSGTQTSSGSTTSGASTTSSATSTSGASSSSSSSSSSSGGTCGGGTAQSSDITIDESSLQQHITGFGVSSAWAGGYNNSSDPEYLWSTTTGAGLSLLRIRYGDSLTIAKSAVQYGVTVWMTPWGTGPGGAPGGPDTTTQNNPNGCNGSMPVLTNPSGLASALSSWVQSAKSQGVSLYAVSAGNEPDSCGINQTTSYSPTEMATWIGGYLGPAMAALGVKVMAPETENPCGFANFFPAIQNNSAAWNSVGIIASHEYGCGSLPSEPSIAAAGKEYWETETDTGTPNGDSNPDDMPSALQTAEAMHNDLTKANANAWHIWWMYENNGSGCVIDTAHQPGTTGYITKRLWTMGNFSRFVRPGSMRVSTSGSAPSGVLITAYVNPMSKALSIVAINSNKSSANASFYLSGDVPCSVTPYVTDANNNLAAQTPVTVASSRFTVSLGAQSVTTFVGTP
jgi:glucuronoarabinoxylan endo-1,4-beta-xylanase